MGCFIRSYNLYENEDGSDIILMVGDEIYRERIPAHSWVLAAGNQVFKAMFQGPLADSHKKIYNIPNDPKGFQNLLRWLYRHECGIQSIDSALITLQVAIQYLCPELAEMCVEYIVHHLSVNNVLKVLQEIYRYCPSQQASISNQSDDTISTAPSAPSLEDLEDLTQTYPNHCNMADSKSDQLERSRHTIHNMTQLQDLCDEADLRDPTACCTDLFNACLEVVDRNTQVVLNSELLEELDHSTLELILRRTTLNVENELPLFEALQRWSTAQCKRHKLPLTQENRRHVLGNLLFHINFLQLNNEQLQQTSSLLTADEFNYLSGRIQGHSMNIVPPTLEPHLSKMARPRRHSPARSMQQVTNDKSKKKCNKKKYTRKELMLDIVSCLAVIFD
ncbi:BTB/POZ domain-containing protein 6 isoform X2 [Procambarus clarkii]|uniref:BTB/POZ domain-containing protein 6 isoform X2 n=1 Tax=Procambarus clarkii TaxID=6728 RepID=UPI001E66FE6A|nr:BTB/POZ domain-containing protein 6-like isoform X2 [Procambarus clarkii]XP_045596933.1 BTB/POZ domain-containing protein 6-like isoform X3 [Procambarus clarkii]